MIPFDTLFPVFALILAGALFRGLGVTDEAFQKKAIYLSVELDYDGQMVREVERAASADSEIHFFGKCGELPTVAELHETFDKLLKGEPITRKGWEREAW